MRVWTHVEDCRCVPSGACICAAMSSFRTAARLERTAHCCSLLYPYKLASICVRSLLTLLELRQDLVREVTALWQTGKCRKMSFTLDLLMPSQSGTLLGLMSTMLSFADELRRRKPTPLDGGLQASASASLVLLRVPPPTSLFCTWSSSHSLCHCSWDGLKHC